MEHHYKGLKIEKKFHDLDEALDLLAIELPMDDLIDNDWLIIAVSEAGVYLGKQIARVTNSKFDFLFSEPVTAPNNSECKIAIVSETEEIVLHTELINAFDISLDYVYGEAHRQYEDKIIQYKHKYRKGESITSLENKKVLFVAEGVDTGLTMMAAIKTAIAEGAATISLATPIISMELYHILNEITDDIYTVHKIEEFVTVGFYYDDVKKLSYEYLKTLIDKGE